MRKRRLRPTFLFQLLVHVLVPVLFVLGALLIIRLSGRIVVTAIVLLLLYMVWVLAVKEELLQDVIIYIAKRRAEKSNRPVAGWLALLFKDIESERRKEFERHISRTSDNPTIR